MFKRLKRHSIWEHGAIPMDEWKYRNLKRIWLPIYDIIVIVAGVLVTLYGLPALDRAFGPPTIDVMGVVLSLVGAVCLAGISFPALWRTEIAGKAILMGILGSYAIACFSFGILDLATGQSAGRIAIAAIVFLTLPLPLFRMALLGDEIRERKEIDDESHSE